MKNYVESHEDSFILTLDFSFGFLIFLISTIKCQFFFPIKSESSKNLKTMKKYTQLAAAGSSDIEKPLLMITKPDNAVEVHSSQCREGGKKTIVNTSSFLQGALVLAALLFGSAIVFSLAGDQEGRKVVNIVVQDENINDMVDISAHSDFNYGASLNASMISMQNVKTVVASTRHGVFSDACSPVSSSVELWLCTIPFIVRFSFSTTLKPFLLLFPFTNYYCITAGFFMFGWFIL